MKTCESCHKPTDDVHTAVIQGIYYRNLCSGCLGSGPDISSGVASFNRRRDWEDNAAATIQPYDANGPNVEFLRMYPAQAKKMYSPEVLAQLKRKI